MKLNPTICPTVILILFKQCNIGWFYVGQNNEIIHCNVVWVSLTLNKTEPIHHRKNSPRSKPISVKHICRLAFGQPDKETWLTYIGAHPISHQTHYRSQNLDQQLKKHLNYPQEYSSSPPNDATTLKITNLFEII